jgi:hypothetical protein
MIISYDHFQLLRLCEIFRILIRNLYIINFIFIAIFTVVTDLNNALPGNSSVNTVQNATIEEVVFSVDPTDAPVDWLDSDHVMCLL